MAGTSYQPIQTESNVKGYEQQGVVDKSGAIRQEGRMADAELLKTAGAQGIEAWKGYAQADLEKTQQGIIQNYMDRNHPVLDGHETNVDKLKAAYDQGLMTPEEFQARIISSTKDAVNQAPGFYPELTGHSQKVLELAGMSGILKQDEKSFKALEAGQADAAKSIVNYAEKFNMPIEYDKINDPFYLHKLNVDTNEYAKRAQASTLLDQGAKEHEQLTKEQVESFVSSGMLDDAIRGTQENVNSTLTNLAGQVNSPNEYAGFKVAATTLIQQKIQNLEQAASKYINDPRVKERLDTTKEQLTTMVSTLNSFAGKEDAQKYLENTTKMLKDNNYVQATQILGNPEINDFITRINPTLLAQMTSQGRLGIVTKVLDRIQRGAEALDEKKPEDNKTIITLLDEATKNPTDGGKKILNNIPVTVEKDLAKFKPQEKYDYSTQYVASLADPNKKDSLYGLDSNSKSAALNTIHGYSATTVALMNKELTSLAKNGKTITMDVLPDGKLHLMGDVPNDVVNKYVNRVNDSISAMANLYGTTTKEAAEKYFYPQFLGGDTSTTTNDPKSNTDVPAIKKTVKENTVVTKQVDKTGSGLGNQYDSTQLYSEAVNSYNEVKDSLSKEQQQKVEKRLTDLKNNVDKADKEGFSVKNVPENAIGIITDLHNWYQGNIKDLQTKKDEDFKRRMKLLGL